MMRRYSPEEAQMFMTRLGPLFAGALFGSGWLVWIDAVMCSGRNGYKTPGWAHVPGWGAVLGIILVNAVRREDVSSEGFEADSTVSQKRAWLFTSYLGCFAALGGALAGLIVYFDAFSDRDKWVGAALVIQVLCILVSGMLFWLTRQVISPY